LVEVVLILLLMLLLVMAVPVGLVELERGDNEFNLEARRLDRRALGEVEVEIGGGPNTNLLTLLSRGSLSLLPMSPLFKGLGLKFSRSIFMSPNVLDNCFIRS